MTKPLRALIVEDSTDDYELLELSLRAAGYDVFCKRVETAAQMGAALRETDWDIVLSDYNLPQFSAPLALDLLKEIGVELPFVVVSGTIGEESAVAAMRRGATDYLLKTNLTRLVPIVERELRENQSRQARRQAEERARQLAAVVQASGEAIISETVEGVITSWNQAAERLFGWSAAEAIGLPFSLLVPPDRVAEHVALMDRLRENAQVEHYESVRVCKDGKRIDVAVTTSPIEDQNGRLIGVATFVRDIRSRKHAEETMRHQTQLLQLILDSIGDGIVVADEQGKLTLFNPAAEQILGLGRTDAPPPDWSERYSVYLPDGVTQYPSEQLPLAKAIHGESVDQVEMVINHHRRPQPVWISVTARPLLREGGDLRGGVAAFRDITEKKKADNQLLLRDRALRAVTSGIVITDAGQPDHPIIFASPGFLRLTGYTDAEVVGRNPRFLQGKDTDPAAVAQIREAVRSGQPCMVEMLNYRKDGTTFWNELSISPITDRGGEVSHFVGVQTDVTRRRQVEEQYRQAQKMDAFGQLAGGVAHDFNNLITIINGYTEILMGGFPASDPRAGLLNQVKKAGDRAAGLTRQLLMFSRKQALTPTVLNLNDVVRDLEKMLRRVIGEDIDLRTTFQEGLGSIKADAGHVEQVLLNLTVNARDAMPRGGTLSIVTSDVLLTDETAQTHVNVLPGPYVLLTVSDTGHGMDAATKARIFEPFFTTKDVGKGTGLGLATVFGIVEQSGGHIAVDSEPGKGATFRLYFPHIDAVVPTKKSDQGLRKLPQGKETILLVEDEEGLRDFTRLVLDEAGYHVLATRDGDEAINVSDQHQGPIHLLLTDVVMPQMSGRQVRDILVARNPKLKVLYLSGYTNDAMLRYGIREEEVAFLQKPFTPAALAQKVRAVLDG
jgi:PAS domain S-box-containing protein